MNPKAIDGLASPEHDQNRRSNQESGEYDGQTGAGKGGR